MQDPVVPLADVAGHTERIGLGRLPQEFAAAGVPFERRGALMDEYLRCQGTPYRPPHPEDWESPSTGKA